MRVPHVLDSMIFIAGVVMDSVLSGPKTDFSTDVSYLQNLIQHKN